MNTEKPRARICRGCRQEFTLEAKNQCYCATCRQVRAEAMEAMRVKVCRRCNVEKDSLKSGICHDCREAKKRQENEEYESRVERINANGGCKQCGQPVTRLGGLCDACKRAEIQSIRERRLEEQRAARQKRLEESKPDNPPAPQDDTDDDDLTSGLVLLIALARLLGSERRERKEAPPAPAEEVNSEELPADDQAAIDAAFRTLMKGLDL